MKKNNIGKSYQWLLWSWIVTAFITLPALFCIHPMSLSNQSESFLRSFVCNHFEFLGFLGSLFGPILLMPLFITLHINHRLAKVFYPGETILRTTTELASIFTALLSIILFIVPITTMNIPLSLAEMIAAHYPILKNIFSIFLSSLWLIAPGMLYLLALFMIQFGTMPKNLNQGYKPLLVYILSGGLVAFCFGIFSSISGLYFSNPHYIPSIFNSFFVNPIPLVKGVLNPYSSLVLDLMTPLPMIMLFKLLIINRIKTK